MNDESSTTQISKQELGILSDTVNRSIEYAHSQSRFIWISLIAGFAVGVFIAVAIMSTMRADQKSDQQTETILKISNETLETVKRIQSEVDRLRSEVDVLSDTAQIAATTGVRHIEAPVDSPRDPVPPAQSAAVPDPASNSVTPGRYTVFIHYHSKKNKTYMEDFTRFLREKGYTVPDIEQVNDTRRDIRYFHGDDAEGAQVLKKHLSEFLTSTAKDDIDMEVRDLSRVYPNASQGALELWIHMERQ